MPGTIFLYPYSIIFCPPSFLFLFLYEGRLVTEHFLSLILTLVIKVTEPQPCIHAVH